MKIILLVIIIIAWILWIWHVIQEIRVALFLIYGFKGLYSWSQFWQSIGIYSLLTCIFILVTYWLLGGQ